MDLSTFLTKLAQSPALRDKFIKDPVAVADEHQLSEADRTALRTGDQAAIDGVLKSDKLWIITEWIIDKQ